MRKEVTIENVVMVDINRLKPNSDNPRNNEEYSVEMLQLLINDIKQSGKIETPLIINKQYIICAGHRRYYSAKYLGYTHLPCIIRDIKDSGEMVFIQISENLKRRYPTFLERGKAYQDLINNGTLKLDEIKKRDHEVIACITTYNNSLKSKNAVGDIKYDSVMAKIQKEKNSGKISKIVFGKRNISDEDRITLFEVMLKKKANTVQAGVVAKRLENLSTKETHSKEMIEGLFKKAMLIEECEFLIYCEDREKLRDMWESFNNSKKVKEEKLSLKEFHAEIIKLLLNGSDNDLKIKKFIKGEEHEKE